MEEMIARQQQQELLAVAARQQLLRGQTGRPAQARLASFLRGLADRLEPSEVRRAGWAR